MFFQGNEKYNCATYLRLSRSDGDQQESNSIKNQRALLNDYMGKHPELHKFDEYVDDGYSGTNFERPDFKRMMQDIEKRNVQGYRCFSGKAPFIESVITIYREWFTVAAADAT